MNKTTVVITAFASLLGLAAACGVPCDMLEDNICEELGEEDCKAWKASGAPEALRSGRRATKGCLNALSGPAFDAHVLGARAQAEAHRLTEGS
ncbi:MAG: hypothetical protein ACRBN8_33205 [Nannocystales bacterium]